MVLTFSLNEQILSGQGVEWKISEKREDLKQMSYAEVERVA